MSVDETAGSEDMRAPSRSGYLKAAIIFCVVAAALVAYGVVRRRTDDVTLASWTSERATPVVTLIAPKKGGEERIITLPGDVEAFFDASIHAQVSGYVRIWRKDIGAIVKKGDILAEIDTPELDEKIVQARQELIRAKAAEALAMVTAQRWRALQSSAAVSRQATDEKESDARVKTADVGVAQANLERLKAQKVFANLVAPFDGVVTARNIDVGAFVSPSSSTKPLYKVADIHAVRIYVNAPQTYAADLTTGMSATFKLPQMPNRVFKATIDTTSNAISKQARTLLVELMADNKDGLLLPGSYTDVRFQIPDSGRLRVPASALISQNDGMQVALLDADDKVHFRKVHIAVDLGTEVEISSGLSQTDRIIDNPPDSLSEGEAVKIADVNDAGAANERRK